MKTTTISITEAKKRWGELVNRVAYGEEWILLLSRGKPKAALVSMADLEFLEWLKEQLDMEAELRQRGLEEEANALREQIVAEVGGPLPDWIEEWRTGGG